MNITLLVSLISGVVAGLIGFGAAWNIQGRAIDSLKMEQKDERITLQRAARTDAERHLAQLAKAQAAAASRGIELERNAAASRGAVDRLRTQSAAALRNAQSSANACFATAAAYDIVLTSCAGRYRELGRKADGHVDDIKTLIESWNR